jgi:hypothetical protein
VPGERQRDPRQHQHLDREPDRHRLRLLGHPAEVRDLELEPEPEHHDPERDREEHVGGEGWLHATAYPCSVTA